MTTAILRVPLVATLLLAGACSRAPLATANASSPGPGLQRGLATADSLLRASIGQLTAGTVLVVAKDGRVVKESAYGYAQLNDYAGRRLATPVPMTTTTVFDLASVTKVMAGTYATMLLVDQGKVDLDAPVYRYLPDFRGVHLDSIRVRHLLTHSAGLVQWQPLYYSASNARETYDVIRRMPLEWGVGEGRHYSDLSFMLIGYLVERVSGQALDVFLDAQLYRPLGLRVTGFNPRRRGLTDFAVTEQGNLYERHMVYDSTFGYRYRGDPTSWNGWRQYSLNGEVDDGNAFYANGGVAGHAGLFSTAPELRVLLDVLLGEGSYAGRRYLSRETVRQFFTLDRYENYLGWQRPRNLPVGSFSHTGFTGTYVLGVPSEGLSVVLLTNKQNMGPNAQGFFPNITPLQEAIALALVRGSAEDRSAQK
jgi:CubicO group peptidase (beta-lactamase class C family)